MQFELYSNC